MNQNEISEDEPLAMRGMGLLGIGSVLTTALLYALPRISFSNLRLLDVDGYMRAQRVVDLMAGNNTWFDAFVYRANAPFGHALHWTRPVDAILIVLSWPFAQFRDLHEAVFLGSFVFGLLMIVSIFLAVAWAARALMGRGASYLAGAATAFQLGLVSYNSPGHPDHHGMIVLFSVLLIGHTLRLLQNEQRSLAIRAGVVAALGLWIATEFLFPLSFCLLALVVKWIVSGARVESLRFFTLALTGSLLVAVVLERPPVSWFVLEAERVSALHVVMAGLLGAAAWVMGKLRADTIARRLVVAGGSAVATTLILLLIFPGFFLGPMQAIQPSVDRFLDTYVTEMAPTWRSVGEEWAGMALLLGAPVLALLQAIERVSNSRKSPLFSSWLLILGWLGATLFLAVVSSRFVPLAEVLVGIPLVAAVDQWLSRPRRPPVLRPLLIVWPLVGYLVLVVAGSAFGAVGAPSGSGNCYVETIEQDLEEALGTQQPIVLAGVPYGPELLWRLPVGVIGTPFLNPAGIEFTDLVFSSDDLEFALAKLDEREVDAIVICEGEAGSEGYRDGQSFYSSLLAKNPIPSWRMLKLPEGSPFRIYLRTREQHMLQNPNYASLKRNLFLASAL